jgi:rubrerythrin
MRIFIISLAAALFLTACEQEQGKQSESLPETKHEVTTEHTHNKHEPSKSMADAKDDTPTEHAEKHADPKYVCSMHPEIVKDKPGSCPICGMFLVKKTTETEEVEKTTEK